MNLGAAVARASPARRLLDQVLSRWDLPAPDGRPLYRYRVTDQEYGRAFDILRTAGATLCAVNRSACAIMVLYASEWFRREATSIWRQWDRLGFLPDDTSVAERSEMVEAGLHYWDIECRLGERGGHTTREFLLTLALNGGIPARLLLGENRHSVVRYFCSVMEEALSRPATPELTSEAFARAAALLLPETYRDPAIFELTAELVDELMRCRSELPKDRRLSNPAALLDTLDPGWRERLPIYLPEDTVACSRLFNDLLAVVPRAKAGGVGVRRVLQREPNGRWVQGFTIEADGLLAAGALARMGEGRYSAFFAGSASKLASREFARIYVSQPDGKNEASVECRALGKLGVVAPVPFEEPITVQVLRKGESPFAMRWPGGERWAASIYVLRRGERDGLLELVGTGSTRSGCDVLFVLASSGSKPEARTGGEAICVWSDEEQSLWRVTGGVVIHTEDEVQFLVQTEQKATEGRLMLPEVFVPGLAFLDPATVPCEAPLQAPIAAAEDGSARPIREGLEWRQGGKLVSDPARIRGAATLRWRDKQGFLIDQRRVVVLPTGFGMTGRLAGDAGVIEWTGLEGWKVVAIQESGAAIASAEGGRGELKVAWQDTMRGRQLLRLRDPLGNAIEAQIDLDADGLMLVDAQGRIVQDKPEISLPSMRGMVLRSNRAEPVDLELRGGGVAAIVMREVEGSTPMSSLHDLAAMLLGLSSQRGPRVVVKDGRGNEICRIRRPQRRPFVDGRTLMFASPISGNAEAVARPLTAPDMEHALEPLGQAGAYRLPERVSGSCLAYLRSGDAVITRPELIDGRPPRSEMQDAVSTLARCTLISNEADRTAALAAAFDELADNPSAGAEIARLVRTVVSLRGLSPRALDWTRLLPECPTLLCRVLLSAAEDEIEAVLSLQRDLPFLWMAQPIAAWRRAIVAELDRAVQEISGFIDSAEQAGREAASDILRRLDAIAAKEAWFAAVKAGAGFKREQAESLGSLAQTHVRNHADLTDPLPTRWVDKAKKHGIPREIRNLNYVRHTTLVAPLLMACLALEKIQMTPELQFALRSALDADVHYVSAAFPYCMEYLNG